MSAELIFFQVLFDFLIRDLRFFIYIADLLLLVFFNLLGVMPHVADVPATVMTEQDAGELNMSIFTVLL